MIMPFGAILNTMLEYERTREKNEEEEDDGDDEE
jgi:hypothetical protein